MHFALATSQMRKSVLSSFIKFVHEFNCTKKVESFYSVSVVCTYLDKFLMNLKEINCKHLPGQ